MGKKRVVDNLCPLILFVPFLMISLFMYKTLFIVVVLTVHAWSACEINPISDMITGTQSFQADEIIIQGTGASINTFNHNFHQHLRSQPHFAFGIWNIEHHPLGTSAPNVFHVQVADLTSGNVMLTVTSTPPAHWQQFKLGFLATVRSDVLVDTVHFATSSLKGKNTLHYTNTVVLNASSSIIRTFLNGWTQSSTSTDFSLSVEGRVVEGNRLGVLIGTGASTDVQNVWYSYLVFSPQTVPFASYGGAVVLEDFAGVEYSNIHNIVHYPQFTLAGLNKLSASGEYSFTSELDDDLVLTLTSGRQISITFTYVLLGYPPRSLCDNCTQTYPYLQHCVTECPVNTYLHSYRDGGVGCRRCSSKLHLVLNSQRNGCVCDRGYVMEAGDCVLETILLQIKECENIPNAEWVASRCQCKEGFTNQTGICFRSFTPINNYTNISTNTSTNTNTNTNPNTNTNTNTNTYTPQIINRVQSSDCSSNSYWTGYRCACKVGYKLNTLSGVCQRYSIKLPEQPQCSLNQFFNGVSCQCLPNYYRDDSGRCVKKTINCPLFSTLINGTCVCHDGYTLINGICIPKVVQCEGNRIYNGVGECVCRSGFYEDPITKECVEGQPCPPFSSRQNGVCVCNVGYIMTDSGTCSRCEEGFFYSNGSCIILCKQNQLYNANTRQCQCREGFGRTDGKCEICTGNTFLKDGFCVSCTVNSVYDATVRECVCEEGFKKVSGLCVKSCSINQIYISSTDSCKCFTGMGRVNGECQTCPVGQQPNPNTQVCQGCQANEVLSGEQCVCDSGYGRSLTGQCIRCEDYGQFLLDGACAVCPPNRQWNGYTCDCQTGYQQSNGACVQKCLSSQAIDANGRCYYCPINQYVYENQCACQAGYGRSVSSGRCEIMCPGNQIVINGQCGICALNSVYNPILGVCVCPTGTYKNQDGYCEQSELTPITCDVGYYKTDDGCEPCADGCARCDSADVCVGCLFSTYEPQGATCVPICGDGIIIRGIEECDDRNTQNSDGCSSICEVEDEYTCSQEPSVCESTSKPTPANCGNGVINFGEECDDGNAVSGDGCDQACEVEESWICEESLCYREPQNLVIFGDIISNSGAVYLTTKTSSEFVFNSEDEMRNFLKFDFRRTQEMPSSAYCNQDLNSKDIFRCIFIYPSGVPLYPYVISLSYDKDGRSGHLDIPLDLRISQMALRSLN